MSAEVETVLDKYQRALRAFLGGAGETALEEAYELGRYFIDAGRGLVEMAAIHSTALANVLPEMERSRPCDVVTREASQMFTEGISPFEMALRGFRETNLRLQAMNATLEARVLERTREVEESRRRYQDLVDRLPAIVYAMRVGPPATLEFVSPQIEPLLGISLYEVTAQSWFEAIHPDDRGELSAQFAKLHDASDWRAEYRVCSAKGKNAWLRDTGRVLTDPRSGTLVLHSVAIDVTEQRAIEDQLRQAQKIEGIGQLAGGVAHDFNNILSVILSFAMLARDEIPATMPEVRSDLNDVIEAAYRAAALTRQLLTFARQHASEPQIVDPNALLKGVEKMLRRLLGESFELFIGVDGDPWNVKIDPGHFEQVLVNLAVNARDAMVDKGRLSISIGKRVSAGEEAVVVNVTDTGAGISDDVRARMFEPFFTTKEQGKGTGLGLATVHGIVRQAGGVIEVDSTVGRGTTFRVALPRVEAKADLRRRDLGPKLVRGHESVLVVEDDPSVREIIVRTLTKSGYTVHEADQGSSALELLERFHIDLLLTDLIMPQIGGAELVARARVTYPELKVVVMSGYTERAIATDQVAVLHKPFTPDVLALKIREVLDP